MATIKIQVTQEGWSIEIEAVGEAETQAGANSTVERIAETFIQARHEIETNVPGYQAEGFQTNGKTFPEDAPTDAETLSD